MYDKIILVVLIVILVIVTVLYFKADWYNKALKKIGLKSDSDVNEGYTNSMLRESKPPVEQRLKSAAYRRYYSNN